MLIREITSSDAEAFLELNRQLDVETSFMLYEPNERTMTVEEQRQMILTVQQSQRSVIFVCEIDRQLVGFVTAIGGKQNRNQHKAHIVAGVCQSFTGKGIGTKLFQTLEAWARKNGLKRLELTVMTHNYRAIGLYEKMGFVIEGTKRCSLIVDGSCVDEYIMAKML